MQETIRIEKLVPGGQGLATLSNGQKIFVWNALPGEEAKVQVWRRKKQFAEGLATEILKSSEHRVEPKEPESYLATSPWQIMDSDYENEQKKLLIEEIFSREKIKLPVFEFTADSKPFHYRNKMEYSFWADDTGLHLALYNRGSHQKAIVTGSQLAMSALDVAAHAILQTLRAAKIQGRQLKTLVVRCSQDSTCVASLFVKDENFPDVTLPEEIKGLRVYYSDPKSPASVMTRLVYEKGDVKLKDTVLGTSLVYDVDSFFQVNVPIFERAVQTMRETSAVSDFFVDMYGGVGSIGLTLSGEKPLTIVELDEHSAAMASLNGGEDTTVVRTSTEQALDYIVNDKVMIFDPPRAGLHPKVIQKILEVLPIKIYYLSCNPVTQARDLASLLESYEITKAEGYNFFPRTPHLEFLTILKRKV